MSKIVILANSRKLRGRCVAGKDLKGNWIRLVKNLHDPIPASRAIHLEMLKIFEVEGIVNKPSVKYNYHTENSNYTRTTLLGNLGRTQLDNLVDNVPNIFGTGKQMSEVEAQKLNYSLIFVKVSNFQIYYKDGGQYPDKLRGSFNYRGVLYTDIAVTDSLVEERLSNFRAPYSEMHAEAYITISIGEIFNRNAYKLISGIVLP
ncbi:MAG: hypothetical protein PHD15_03685 [Clostridia bacterium]|nr:hypothetical protein [Clostridia bacterium]MDD4386843.1 hypothetical protein [Clostridia bacterium]